MHLYVIQYYEKNIKVWLITEKLNFNNWYTKTGQTKAFNLKN